MAQQVNIVLVDDIDGTPADETVSFALDGKEYEIDLTTKNATKLRDAIAPYLGHARKAASRRRGRGASAGGPSPADIRAWARENGFDVPDRGRVSSEVRDAYFAAH
jgi:hypothetical protein